MRVTFELVSPETSISHRELKKALNTIKINDYNKDVKKMLTTMQMICNEIFQTGYRCEKYEEDMLSALGTIQNEELKLKIMLLKRRRDRGEDFKA